MKIVIYNNDIKNIIKYVDIFNGFYRNHPIMTDALNLHLEKGEL